MLLEIQDFILKIYSCNVIKYVVKTLYHKTIIQQCTIQRIW